MADNLAIAISGFFAVWFLFYMVRWFGLWMMNTWIS